MRVKITDKDCVFKTEKDAAKAYNKAALAEWGEFAWLNKLD